MKTVLVIDDSLYMRTLISDGLSSNYNIVGMASNGENGIDQALELRPDIITLDNILPDMLGIDVLNVLRLEGVKSTIIMVSAVGQDQVVLEALDAGANDYLVKPFTIDMLVDKIENNLI